MTCVSPRYDLHSWFGIKCQHSDSLPSPYIIYIMKQIDFKTDLKDKIYILKKSWKRLAPTSYLSETVTQIDFHTCPKRPFITWKQSNLNDISKQIDIQACSKGRLEPAKRLVRHDKKKKSISSLLPCPGRCWNTAASSEKRPRMSKGASQ